MKMTSYMFREDNYEMILFIHTQFTKLHSVMQTSVGQKKKKKAEAKS